MPRDRPAGAGPAGRSGSPRADTPVFAETDVLVVGGGPAGRRRRSARPAWART